MSGTSAVPPPQHRNPQTTSGSAPAEPATAASAQDVTPPKEWTEDDYVLALAHLEQLQDVVSSLRTTIPQLVRALTRKHERPRDLYADFAKETLGGGRKLADLKKLWEGSQMGDVRSRVDSSVKEHGRSIEGVPEEYRDGVKEMLGELPRYGWIEAGQLLQGEKRTGDGEGGSTGVLSDDEAQKVVESFGKNHEGITASIGQDSKLIGIVLTPSDDGLQLNFDVSLSTKDGKAVYNVSGPAAPESATKSERKFYQAIQRCLAKRQTQGSLEHTLETLAAYKDLTVKCEVCQKLVDGEMLLPAARRSKRVKTGDVEATKWAAVHESCLKGDG